MQRAKFRIGMGSFDFIKGMAMIFVMLGHMTFEYDLSGWIYRSPVLRALGSFFSFLNLGVLPCFFLITGYTFKRKEADKMLKWSFRNLIYPYAVVGLMGVLVHTVVNIILYGIQLWMIEDTASWLFAFLFGIHDPWEPGRFIWGIHVSVCGFVWYLLALFFSINIFNQIIKMKSKYARFALTLFCAIIGLFLAECGFTFYCIPQGMIATIYLLFGYEMKKMNFFERNLKTQFGVVLLCYIVATSACYSGKFDMAFNIYENAPIVLTGSACGGLVVFVCGVYLGKLEWKAFDLIRVVGVYSLYVICIHSVEYKFLPWYLIYLSMPTHMGLSIALEILLRIIIIGSVCVIVKKINYQKYRRMRRKNGN